MTLAGALVGFGEIWLIIGGLVALAFVTVGIDRIDEDSRGAYVFRPLIVPGVLLLWPLVVWRWWVLESGRDDPDARYHPVRRAHAGAAMLMAAFILGIIALGLGVRQEWPADIAPERLSAATEASQ